MVAVDMTKSNAETLPPGISENSVAFSALDGVELSGTWFMPRGDETEVKAAIVIVCGGGIPARFYRRLARYLAGRGAAVLTFDYRGIGGSRRGSLRGLQGGVDVWAVYDLGAALALARSEFSQLPLEAVAHSIGALLIGAAPDASRLSRLVFFGPHTGYWRDYAPRWRWLLHFTWHIVMPAATKVFGYFPGKALGLGEDLPPGIARDWAGRRQPEFFIFGDSRPIDELLGRYTSVRASTLALSVSDDAFAPGDAARRLLALYPNLRVKHEIVTPASVGRRRLGHFGFLRRPAGEVFWERAAAWLLSEQIP